MSRIGNTVAQRAGAAACLAVILAAAPAAAADLVVLRDGSEIEGHVVLVDETRAVIRLPEGRERVVARKELARIEFGEEPEIPLPRVRVRVLDADDEVHLYLDDEEIAPPAQLLGEWVDLGPRLREGANHITAEVRNETSVWAYRWVIDVGGRRYTFACGLARKSGCREEGHTGREVGTMPAGSAWLYVDRESGTVEVER
ncbi:MAG: hypothetical protein D6718_06300 [Acidobacteria bacterium]|nr:MAG: hypothetical protein D6718_06300 [Acidobacteriota bacterium]